MSDDEIIVRDVPAGKYSMSTYDHTFLRASDLQGKRHTLIIEEVREVETPSTKGSGRETKPLVMFRGAKRPWIVAITNTICINAMFGETYAHWKGHAVTIQSELVDVGGETKPAIRVVGSPELDKPIVVLVPKGRGKVKRTLIKTDPAPAPAAPAATTESAEPTTTEG